MGGFFSGFGFGDLLGGVTSVAGSIANVVTSKKARKWQSQENERQRQYMSELANRQNQWNLEQWNRENAYNSPSNKMKLLREAGLNPDLMYGQGAGSLQAASSPQLTAGEAGPTMDYSKFMPNLELSSIAQNMASARLMNAQAKKTDSETTGQELQNFYQSVLNKYIDEDQRQHLKLQHGEIIINGKVSEELAAQINLLNNQADEVQQSIDESKKRVEKMDNDMQLAWMNFYLDASEIQALIEKIQAETDLTREQARMYVAKTQAEINGINADIAYKAALGTNVNANTRKTWAETRTVWQRNKHDKAMFAIEEEDTPRLNDAKIASLYADASRDGVTILERFFDDEETTTQGRDNNGRKVKQKSRTRKFVRMPKMGGKI